MDPSSSSFQSYDIEAAKRRIKCDSWLFLVLYFIPNLLTIFTGSPRLAIEFIFWISIIYSPYWITALLGFLAYHNELSFINCYSGMLKCTLIYIIIGTGAVLLIFLFLAFAISRYQSGKFTPESFLIAGLAFIVIICLIYSALAIVLWYFANKHANSLKDLISRKTQYFQNQNMAGRLSTNAQFFPAPGIEIGRYPQHYPQYEPDSFGIP